MEKLDVKMIERHIETLSSYDEIMSYLLSIKNELPNPNDFMKILQGLCSTGYELPPYQPGDWTEEDEYPF